MGDDIFPCTYLIDGRRCCPEHKYDLMLREGYYAASAAAERARIVTKLRAMVGPRDAMLWIGFVADLIERNATVESSWAELFADAIEDGDVKEQP